MISLASMIVSVKSDIYSRDHPYDPESRDIGFQVIRVKNAEHGEGKVRVTAYYHSNSHVSSD